MGGEAGADILVGGGGEFGLPAPTHGGYTTSSVAPVTSSAGIPANFTTNMGDGVCSLHLGPCLAETTLVGSGHAALSLSAANMGGVGIIGSIS